MARSAIVIGAGITGTLTALQLQDQGWAVTLLEAQHLGAGSSSRTAAGFRQQFTTRETVLGMRYAVDFYNDWQARTGGEGRPIQSNGYLFLLPNAPDVLAGARIRVESQRAWGLKEVEALSPEQVQSRFSWVDPESIGGATWCPSDGFLRPEVLYNEAAQGLRQRGGTLKMNSAVVSAERAGDRLLSVTTAKGETLSADLFVDCTNAWSRRLGDILGAKALPVAALKRYLWFLERDDQAMSAEQLLSMPLVISPSGAYCRPENAGSLMIGWKHAAPDQSADFSYEDQDSVQPEFFHRSGADARPFETWMALAEVLPPVAEFKGISATTAGFYGTTPDHNPFMDFDPNTRNLIRLVGFSGHGAMFGPFSAKVCTALAEAGRSIDHVTVLGEQASLGVFQIDREFRSAEAMVI